MHSPVYIFVLIEFPLWALTGHGTKVPGLWFYLSMFISSTFFMLHCYCSVLITPFGLDGMKVPGLRFYLSMFISSTFFVLLLSAYFPFGP
jgi:hypothetical protein